MALDIQTADETGALARFTAQLDIRVTDCFPPIGEAIARGDVHCAV